jgi:hypothetical protein
MSILWLNRPRRFIIPLTHTTPKSILRVGILCTRYHHIVDCLSQTMKITTSTQTQNNEEFYQEEGLQGRFEIDLTEAIGMDVQ